MSTELPAAEQADRDPDVAAAIESLRDSAMASLGQLGAQFRKQREELARARAEILAVLDGLGQSAIRVREGDGPENIFASLAVTVARLQQERDQLRIKYANMFSALNAKQAKIDALMLEFCPGEMSASQRNDRANSQRASQPPAAAVLFAMRDWIESAPHGDSCFVTDEYPGNQCACGKESLSRVMDDAFGVDESSVTKAAARDEWVDIDEDGKPVRSDPFALNLAPIAKVIVREDGPAQVEMYAPGLPVGTHDVFPVPVDPKGEWRPFLAGSRGPLTLDTDRQVFFYEQDHYYLSNFSAFRLRWDGIDFDTSEHAYHWEKFKISGVDTSPAGRLIYVARSAHDAFKIAEAHKGERRADWDEVKVDAMRRILREKVRQHEYVRRKLLQTGDSELIENSWRDPYWGWGPNRDGLNMLGKLWMEIRAELRAMAAVHGVAANDLLTMNIGWASTDERISKAGTRTGEAS